MVEQEGNGVTQDLPQQPAAQMPRIVGPYPLYGVALCELRKDGVDPVAKAAQIGALLWGGVPLLGGVRSKEFYAHSRQLFLGVGRVVIAVSDEKAKGSLTEFGEHGKFVDVGGGHREASDEPRPTEPYVHPKAVEGGLPKKRVLAESRLSSEAAAAVSAGEETRWQGKRVADGEASIVRSESEEFLPETLLDLPEVGSLPSEGGPMHLTEGRKPFTVVAAEERVYALVGVEPKELADHFDGEDLGIGDMLSLGEGPREGELGDP
jgi:hypothetical protein